MAKLKSTSIYSSNRLPLIIHNKKKKMKDYTIELMGQCLSKGIAVYSISIHSGYKMCALLTLYYYYDYYYFHNCYHSHYECYWYYYISFFLMLLSLISDLVIWRNIPPSKANIVYFFPILMTNFKYQIIHKEMTYHRSFQKAEVQHLLGLYW